MKTFNGLYAFIIAAILLTLTPGLDTTLILRTAAVEGSKKAFQVSFGINAGCFLWGIAVALGLGALIAVSEFAYSLIKYCGAAYLAYLGIQLLMRKPSSVIETNSATVKGSNWFLRGLLGNAMNPKIGIFYVSFLPQFIPVGESAALWTMILVGIHILLSMIWAFGLILATTPISHFLKQENVARWLDRVTGSLFLIFAFKLVMSNRTQ